MRVIDLVGSNNTLEHLPVDVLAAVLAEIRRLCKPTGVAYLAIDYGDHYAYSDHSITVYNMLRFSDEDWARHNHRMMYVNRLRHSDWRRLLVDHGFEILDEATAEPRDSADKLASVPLAPRFRAYDRADLLITGGRFFLRVRRPR